MAKAKKKTWSKAQREKFYKTLDQKRRKKKFGITVPLTPPEQKIGGDLTLTKDELIETLNDAHDVLSKLTVHQFIENFKFEEKFRQVIVDLKKSVDSMHTML